MFDIHDLVGDTLIKKILEKEVKEEHAEIPYEDTSVRELLTLMKDNSELITDLAYAAIAFDSKELAEEVRHLETEMDKMMYQIRLKCMLSARTIEDAEQLSGLLQVASAAEKISDAVEDMVELLDMDVELRPILPHILKEADEKIHTVKIYKDSDIANRSIGSLQLESHTGVRVIAVRRKNRWIYGPDADTILRAEDLMVVRGVEMGYEELREVAHGQISWRSVI
ncbi:MAG: TrkA C-terminal domain-containing protein [Thermoplasmata archaeon]